MIKHTQTSLTRRWGRHAGVLLLACGFSLPLYAASSAAKLGNVSAPPPTAHALRSATAAPEFANRHHQTRPLTPKERPPQSASREHLRVDYDRPQQRVAATTQLRMAAAAASCDVGALAAASGSTLVSLVRNASVDGCINTLFSLTGADARNVFAQAKMVSIADALRSDSASYAGDNSNGALQLVLFLRAGYYVQYYDPINVGAYGASLKNAIRPALDAFVANPHFTDVNDQHGAVLTEFVTLIDSAGENARQLPAVKGLLDRYNSSYHSHWYMMTAVNNVFTVLFRGQYDADYVAAVQADSSITTSLSGFIDRNAAEVGTDNDYLLSNAGRELARFLQYASLKPVVRPQVRTLLSRYSMTGTGAGIWVATADVTDYYDAANCSYYNICGFRTQLAQVALPITYQCSTDLRLRAQALTSAQITETCNELINLEGHFHQKLNTNQTPVADDYNTMLELVVFDSSTDYQTYSGVLFGNDTNNGGMYLEGDPSVVGNQARFLAYEAEWVLPAFEVWNLTHEYVHYLDGRFNMHGDFGDAMSQSTVWWVEGLAEYISYGYRGLAYANAVNAAGTLAYPLSTIYGNDYNSGQDRVYSWGYLAVRYMFEKQPAEVGSILGYFRPGNYTGYGSYLNTIRHTHDSDWNLWLTCLSTSQGDTSSCGGSTNPDPDPQPDPNLSECTDASQLKNDCQRSNVQATRAGDSAYFYIWVPAGSSTLQVTTSGGTGNADLYVSGSSWPSSGSYERKSTASGNSEQISLTPSAAGGYYYIALVANTPFSGVTIHASTGPTSTTPPAPVLPECTGGSNVLSSGCQHSNLQTTRANDVEYFYLWVPNGSTRLSVKTAGGTGNADLYVSGSNWPSTSSYDKKSTTSGNSESVDVTSPQGGRYYYVAVVATAPYAGVAVSAQLTP